MKRSRKKNNKYKNTFKKRKYTLTGGRPDIKKEIIDKTLTLTFNKDAESQSTKKLKYEEIEMDHNVRGSGYCTNLLSKHINKVITKNDNIDSIYFFIESSNFESALICYIKACLKNNFTSIKVAHTDIKDNYETIGTYYTYENLKEVERSKQEIINIANKYTSRSNSSYLSKQRLLLEVTKDKSRTHEKTYFDRVEIEKVERNQIIKKKCEELFKDHINYIKKSSYIIHTLEDYYPSVMIDDIIENREDYRIMIIMRTNLGIVLQFKISYNFNKKDGLFIKINKDNTIEDININTEGIREAFIDKTILNKGNMFINEFIEKNYIKCINDEICEIIIDIHTYKDRSVVEFEFNSNNYIFGKTKNGYVIQKKEDWIKQLHTGIYVLTDNNHSLDIYNSRNNYKIDEYFKEDHYKHIRELIEFLKNNKSIFENFLKLKEEKEIIVSESNKRQDTTKINIKKIGTQKESFENLDESYRNDKAIELIRSYHKGKNIQKSALENAKNCYPIIDTSLEKLILDFINLKINQGTKIEKKLYGENFKLYKDTEKISKFINRILFKRPKTFQLPIDQYKFRSNNETGYNGLGSYDKIELNDNKVIEELRLEQTISYYEMEISALVSMSWTTPVVNDGNRLNYKYAKNEEDCTNLLENLKNEPVIYIGCIGARFERNYEPRKMETKYMLIDRLQNTRDNGYGLENDDRNQFNNEKINEKRNYLKIWYKFYTGEEGNFPTYNSVIKTEIVNQNTRYIFDNRLYTQINSEFFLNNIIYKSRMKKTILPFLLDAESRGVTFKKEVYCHLVGLGIGAWQIDAKVQANLIYDVYIDIFKKNNFKKIKVLDFSWFPEPYPSDNKFSEIKTDIKIIFSKNSPFGKSLDKHNKLIVAQFAWDSNSYPGNEFWLGEEYFAASGDPAAACCSGIAAIYQVLENEINPENQYLISYSEGEQPQSAPTRGAVLPEQELAVISNSGIPEKNPTMKNQCFWISLLQWIKNNKYTNETINYINLDVQQLKEIANNIKLNSSIKGNKLVNDKFNQLEIIQVDGDGVYNRLNHLAKMLGVYIQVFIYDTKKERIVLSKECKDKGLDSEECKNQDSPYTYGDSKSKNRIFIVSYGNHFELITKLNENNFNYEAPFFKHHVKTEKDDKIYYNHNGDLVNWANLNSDEQIEIQNAEAFAKAAADAGPKPRAPAPAPAPAPAQPARRETQLERGATQPERGATQPERGATQPERGATQPARGEDRPAQPARRATQLERGKGRPAPAARGATQLERGEDRPAAASARAPAAAAASARAPAAAAAAAPAPAPARASEAATSARAPAATSARASAPAPARAEESSEKSKLTPLIARGLTEKSILEINKFAKKHDLLNNDNILTGIGLTGIAGILSLILI